MGRYLDRWLNPKISQEDMDIYNASVLLMAHNWHQRNNAKEMNDELGSKLYDRVDQMLKTQRQLFVQKEISRQVESMFNIMHEVMTENAQTSLEPLYHPPSKEVITQQPILKEPYQHRINKQQLLTKVVGKESIRDRIGFEITLRPSTVSGNGVFIDRDVIPGTVVGLFGGDVHPLEYIHATYLEDKGLIPDENFMLMVRTDGHIIDGNTTKRNAFNPYALAHMVNHPPKDINPNVMAV